MGCSETWTQSPWGRATEEELTPGGGLAKMWLSVYGLGEEPLKLVVCRRGGVLGGLFAFVKQAPSSPVSSQLPARDCDLFRLALYEA